MMDVMCNILVGCCVVIAVGITLGFLGIVVRGAMSLGQDVATNVKEFNDRDPISKMRYADRKKVQKLLRDAMNSAYNDVDKREGYRTLFNIVEAYNNAVDETQRVNEQNRSYGYKYFG